MDNPIIRRIAGLVAGLVVMVLVVSLVEGAGHTLYPPPDGLDITRPEDQARLMAVIPLEAKIAVVAAWFLGALAGSAVAMAIGRTPLLGWAIGIIMGALSLFTTQMFPHPLWMMIAAVVLPLVAVLVAKKLVAGRLTA
jgi:hypothetical protein